MKNKTVFNVFVAFLLLSVALFLGCNVAATEAVTIFTLLVGNTWVDESNAAHTVFMKPNGDDRTASGTFTGRDQLEGRVDDIPVSGSWGNNEITLTLQSIPPKTYKADITENNPTRLVFQGPERLVLIQQN